MVVALALAVVIGLSLGLLGSGGSILTLPAMVYGAGVSEHDAIPMSLAVVGVTAAVGAILQGRRGWVDWRAAILFASGGALGAVPGGLLSERVPGTILMLLFGLIMLVVAFRMLRGPGGAPATVNPTRPVPAVLAGAGVGGLTAFLGAGGGFLAVPALERFLGLSLPRAMATSLVVIAANCAMGLAVHAGRAQFDWGLTIAFGALALLGMGGGILLGSRLPPRVLRLAFGSFILLMALFVFVQNRSVFFPGSATSVAA